MPWELAALAVILAAAWLWRDSLRALGHYSRGLNLLPLETAAYKMTGLTAKPSG